MVSEMQYDPETGLPTVSAKQAIGMSDPWAHLSVRKMIALYDYDPQELSPNPDTDVSVFFATDPSFMKRVGNFILTPILNMRM
jgi:hypothetical protein